MDPKLTLRELEDSYIEDLDQLDDWLLQYEYLLALSAQLPAFAKDERTENSRVKGCQSGVWLVLHAEDGRVRIRADSEALIIRGILAILVSLLDGRTPEEIASYRPRFIEQTNIKKQISTDRFHGLQSVVQTVREFALQVS